MSRRWNRENRSLIVVLREVEVEPGHRKSRPVVEIRAVGVLALQQASPGGDGLRDDCVGVQRPLQPRYAGWSCAAGGELDEDLAAGEPGQAPQVAAGLVVDAV